MSLIQSFNRANRRTKLLVLLVVSIPILILRRPEAFYRPQFWAEDMFFLITAEKLGLASLWTPQAGYFQVLPRLVALPTTFLDPVWQPAFFLFAALVTLLAVVLTCLSPRIELPCQPYLALAVLLVPHTGEVFLNLTNAQWIAALGLLLTALKRDPESAWEWGADLAWIAIAGLSGPFIVLALPLFVLRARSRGSAKSLVLLGVGLLIGGAQAWCILHQPPLVKFVDSLSGPKLLAMAALRWPDNTFFGAVLAGAPRMLIIGVGCLVLGFLGYHSVRVSQYRTGVLAMLFFMMALIAAAEFRMRFDLWAEGDLASGDRYFFIPKVLLLWITIVLLLGTRRTVVKYVLAVLLVASAVFNVPRFRFERLPDQHWYEACPNIRAGRPVVVTVNPGWKFHYVRGSLESNGPY